MLLPAFLFLLLAYCGLRPLLLASQLLLAALLLLRPFFCYMHLLVELLLLDSMVLPLFFSGAFAVAVIPVVAGVPVATFFATAFMLFMVFDDLLVHWLMFLRLPISL